MITQVFHQDHLKVDGLRNQTVKDSSGRCNKQKLTLKGLKLGLIFLDRPLSTLLWDRLI